MLQMLCTGSPVNRCAILVIPQGFEWKDEGKAGRHKWGYVSWHPGDKILLKARQRIYVPVGALHWSGPRL